jgi:hypothetical protein
MLREPTSSLDDVASSASLGSDAQLAEQGLAAGGALEPFAVGDQLHKVKFTYNVFDIV